MKELTQQQKLEILCAYLPHGVELMCDGKPYQNLLGITLLNPPEFQVNFGWGDAKFMKDSDVRPILRHPDDMTVIERKKYRKIVEGEPNFIKSSIECLKYLWSIHIDTFGAIESGWAIRKESK